MSSNEYTLHGRHSTVYRYPTYAEARKAMTPVEKLHNMCILGLSYL